MSEPLALLCPRDRMSRFLPRALMHGGRLAAKNIAAPPLSRTSERVKLLPPLMSLLTSSAVVDSSVDF